MEGYNIQVSRVAVNGFYGSQVRRASCESSAQGPSDVKDTENEFKWMKLCKDLSSSGQHKINAIKA